MSSLKNGKEYIKYLKLLSTQYPTIQSVCTEIINLQAILNLPKGTEHFLSDLHGEYESFLHILKNASGVIKSKIDNIYGTTISMGERKSLATLIYYPEQKLEMIKKEIKDKKEKEEWYRITLYRLIQICKVTSSKYTRSKVRKALPKEYEYIIDELLHSEQNSVNKETYYNQIIDTIINLDRADAFIIAISKLIQRLSIDHLHIIGDIYDRGPGPHIIMDELMNYHSIDIQWGNHDIVWMGAAAGSKACVAIVLRNCARYNNLDILEEAYGINIRPISEFAVETYKNDNSAAFKPKALEDIEYKPKDLETMAKIQKAAAIIQFKLEGQLIKKHPEFKMKDRLLLDKIDYQKGTITIKEKTYELNNTYFPTINPENPYELTKEEQEVIDKITSCFMQSEKLQRHVNFLFTKGGLYKKINSNLLIHGCIPMESDGTLTSVEIKGKNLSGKEYLDYAEQLARRGYLEAHDSKAKQYGEDFIWYLWCGPGSPLFGKDAMKTFEKYFIDDKEVGKEIKNPFYTIAETEEGCERIFEEFKLDKEKSHIICGHVPVKFKHGESPIKANGKLIIIDGGLSKAYQPTTGIAGYTLIYNSFGLCLTSHEPFESTQKAIEEEGDIHSTTLVVEKVSRKKVADTDIGLSLKGQIEDLEGLLKAYRGGIIKEKIQ